MHKAEQFAIEVAKENGYKNVPRRLLDTHFATHDPCWEITPGLVVYEDEPDCVVSLQWHEGRFKS